MTISLVLLNAVMNRNESRDEFMTFSVCFSFGDVGMKWMRAMVLRLSAVVLVVVRVNMY